MFGAVRDSGDSVVSVVRIRLARERQQDTRPNRLILTCTLDNRDQGRVSVPEIEVLGNVKGRRLIILPNRLTTEAIDWRIGGVLDIQLQEQENWEEPFGDLIEDPGMYSGYVVDKRNWSVQLEPLSQAAVDPVILCCDARVYLASEQAIVYQRFDVLPETQSEILISLPRNSKCIGIWAAGREVSLPAPIREYELSDADSAPASNQRISVPLAYSRLSQSIEVFMHVAASEKAIKDYLCRPVNLRLDRQWLSIYRAPTSGSSRILTLAQMDNGHSVSSADNRNEMAFALAESAVTAIERSRDLLAERSDEEISRWLLPWIARYDAVASLVGHRFIFESPDGSSSSQEEEIDSESEGLSQELPILDPRWGALDDRLLTFAGRFSGARSLPIPFISSGRFSDYELLTTTNLPPGTEPPRILQKFAQRKGLQRSLFNAITLITFGLAIILLWPFRGRYRSLIRHPALWLLTLGLIGCFLIPLPLASAIIIVALTVPAIKKLQHKPAATPSVSSLSRET